jgi:hypothetical protein
MSNETKSKYLNFFRLYLEKTYDFLLETKEYPESRRQYINGFMMAGRIIGLFSPSDLQEVIEEVHSSKFGMTVQERETLNPEQKNKCLHNMICIEKTRYNTGERYVQCVAPYSEENGLGLTVDGRVVLDVNKSIIILRTSLDGKLVATHNQTLIDIVIRRIDRRLKVKPGIEYEVLNKDQIQFGENIFIIHFHEKSIWVHPPKFVMKKNYPDYNNENVTDVEFDVPFLRRIMD